MTADVATTAEKWGVQTCTRQARLLARQQTTPAEATDAIVHALHRMAGLTPPQKETS